MGTKEQVLEVLMFKKVISLERSIAIPFRVEKDGYIAVSDHNLVMDDCGEWLKEKQPGRPKMGLHLKTMTPSEKKADAIVQNPNLTGQQRAPLVNRLSQFFDAAIKLNDCIRKPSGNVDVSVDSVELRNLWHLYLLRGREVIDEIGRKIKTSYGLTQQIHGLNAKKFNALEKIIERDMRKRENLNQLLNYIRSCKGALIEFIELRNRAKTENDTLVEPPSVSTIGNPKGGKIVNRHNNKEYVFVDYFYDSFKHIKTFAETILGSKNLTNPGAG